MNICNQFVKFIIVQIKNEMKIFLNNKLYNINIRTYNNLIYIVYELKGNGLIQPLEKLCETVGDNGRRTSTQLYLK